MFVFDDCFDPSLEGLKDTPKCSQFTRSEDLGEGGGDDLSRCRPKGNLFAVFWEFLIPVKDASVVQIEQEVKVRSGGHEGFFAIEEDFEQAGVKMGDGAWFSVRRVVDKAVEVGVGFFILDSIDRVRMLQVPNIVDEEGLELERLIRRACLHEDHDSCRRESGQGTDEKAGLVFFSVKNERAEVLVEDVGGRTVQVLTPGDERGAFRAHNEEEEVVKKEGCF